MNMNPKEYNFYKKYKRNCKVFVQIKPSIESSWDNVKILEDRKSIYVRYPQDFAKGNLKKEQNFWHFHTDGILYNSHPLEIYQIVTEGLLESAVEGNDVIILAYGQTGCGKSTTINGLQNSYENRGISLRLIADLFELAKNKEKELKMEIKMSYVEVRKSHIIDLTADEEEKIYMPYKEIVKNNIESVYNALLVIFKAEMKRMYASHSVYYSHIYPSVLTIHLKNISLIKSNPVDTYSKIHIIDLAGADTDGNISCLHKTNPEIGSANLIKTQIEQILLYYNKYPGSRNQFLRGKGNLVKYLNDSLRPESAIRFIAHINSDLKNLQITLSHLRFGHIAQCIAPAKLKPKLKTNKELQIEILKNKVDYYEHQLVLDSMLMNKDLTNFLPKQRAEQVQNMVNEFVSGNVSDLALLNVCDAQITLNTLKRTYEEDINQLKNNIIEMEEQIDILQNQLDKGSSSNKTSDITEISNSTKKSKKKQGTDKHSSHTTTATTATENIAKKSSRVGSIENYGKSLGKRHSSKNGNSSIRVSQIRTKSGKSHSTRSSIKRKQASGPLTVSRESEHSIESLLMMNIKNYEDVWKIFTNEEIFERSYKILKDTIESYKKIMETYNKCIHTIETLNKKKLDKQAYQTKILFFKENKKFDCSVDEDAKLKLAEKSLQDSIECITFNLNFYKENLLTHQADLKITADHIKDIKQDICDNFMKFCAEHYGSKFGDGSFFIEEMVSNEYKPIDGKPKEQIVNYEENSIMNTYYELQHEMLKYLENKKK